MNELINYINHMTHKFLSAMIIGITDKFKIIIVIGDKKYWTDNANPTVILPLRHCNLTCDLYFLMKTTQMDNSLTRNIGEVYFYVQINFKNKMYSGP